MNVKEKISTYYYFLTLQMCQLRSFIQNDGKINTPQWLNHVIHGRFEMELVTFETQVLPYVLVLDYTGSRKITGHWTTMADLTFCVYNVLLQRTI